MSLRTKCCFVLLFGAASCQARGGDGGSPACPEVVPGPQPYAVADDPSLIVYYPRPRPPVQSLGELAARIYRDDLTYEHQRLDAELRLARSEAESAWRIVKQLNQRLVSRSLIFTKERSYLAALEADEKVKLLRAEKILLYRTQADRAHYRQWLVDERLPPERFEEPVHTIDRQRSMKAAGSMDWAFPAVISTPR